MQHRPLICARAWTECHKGDLGAGFGESRGEAAGIGPHPTHRVGGHQDAELRRDRSWRDLKFESIEGNGTIVLDVAELVEQREIVPMRAFPGEIVGLAP